MRKKHNEIIVLDEKSLVAGAHHLAAGDFDFAHILRAYGQPPLWAREPGFPTLIHIILEQQVSLASARAAFDRLCAAIVPLTPERFLTLDDVTLKAIGFSRQKMNYVRLLAQEILAERLDLEALRILPDDEVRDSLKRLKGVGDWTADIYLLMALRRADVWPKGDLALMIALQKLKKLPARPAPEIFMEWGEQWKPLRAIAARFLWLYYLKGKNQTV